MDEDSAGVQYSMLGFTKLIENNDEEYIHKFMAFLGDSDQHKSITRKHLENDFLKEENLIKIIVERYYNK